MSNLGIPVPAGFTITTDVCVEFYKNNRQFPSSLEKEVETALQKVEKTMGATFGDPSNPLLVVRPLRRACLHARHDGYRPEPGSQ